MAKTKAIKRAPETQIPVRFRHPRSESVQPEMGHQAEKRIQRESQSTRTVSGRQGGLDSEDTERGSSMMLGHEDMDVNVQKPDNLRGNFLLNPN
jgi:hypothetical protein